MCKIFIEGNKNNIFDFWAQPSEPTRQHLCPDFSWDTVQRTMLCVLRTLSLVSTAFFFTTTIVAPNPINFTATAICGLATIGLFHVGGDNPRFAISDVLHLLAEAGAFLLRNDDYNFGSRRVVYRGGHFMNNNDRINPFNNTRAPVGTDEERERNHHRNNTNPFNNARAPIGEGNNRTRNDHHNERNAPRGYTTGDSILPYSQNLNSAPYPTFPTQVPPRKRTPVGERNNQYEEIITQQNARAPIGRIERNEQNNNQQRIVREQNDRAPIGNDGKRKDIEDTHSKQSDDPNKRARIRKDDK